MLRRCQFLLVSLAVCVASVLPSFAWSEESFVGEDNLEALGYEANFVVPDAPMIFSVSPSAVVEDDSIYSHYFSGADFFSLLDYSAGAQLWYGVRYDGISLPGVGVNVPGSDYLSSYPSDSFLSPVVSSASWASSFGYFARYRGVLPAPESSSFHNTFVSFLTSGVSSSFPFLVPVDSFGDFTSFSLGGMLRVSSRQTVNGFTVNNYKSSVDVVVNGQVFDTFYSNSSGYIDFGGAVLTSSVPITSLSFDFNFSFTDIPLEDEEQNSDNSFDYLLILESPFSSEFVFSILKGHIDAPPTGIEDADQAIGNYGSAEEQYFSDATDAVSSLPTDVPGGMLDSAAMIGGLFNDLWTVLGDFSLIYFIPLLFSFFLWIIGRKRGGSG